MTHTPEAFKSSSIIDFSSRGFTAQKPARAEGIVPHYSLLSGMPCIMEEGSLLQYDGTLFSVFDDLNYFLQAPTHEQDSLTLVRNPELIVRSLVDMNIAVGGDPDYERVLRESIQAMQAVYRGDNEASQVVASLATSVFSLGADLKDFRVEQPGDGITLAASDPKRSEGAAQLLHKMFRGKQLLLVPLAHGAVIAGMDVFLYYQGLSGLSDGVFYPLRFSRHKKGDQFPRFSADESDYLAREAEGREIVIFEEDVQSGQTHRIAKKCAEENFFPGREITMLTNYTLGQQVGINYDLD